MYKCKLMLPNGKWKTILFKSKQQSINELEKYIVYLESVIDDINEIIIKESYDDDYDIFVCR